MNSKIKIAIIGASGYTGSELIRLLLNHSKAEITALVANNNAGSQISDIYSHLSNFALPQLVKLEEVDFKNIDLAFCCLPHTASQEVIKSLFADSACNHLKIIDLSADFRLQNINDYKKWYGNDHIAPEIQQHAVYGLSEAARNQIKKSRLIACPGCYPTSVLLPLLPLLKNRLITADNIIIDSKSGVSGAGRSLKTGNLYCEVNDSVKAYSVCNHRHIAEIEQELSGILGGQITVDFTPHLIPMSRGIISTIYINIKEGFALDNLKDCLHTTYEDEYFVNVIDNPPSTKDVFATNFCNIALFKGRGKNRAVIVSVIDNLVKGASGQAVQNMNIIYGLDERTGLTMSPVFP